MTDILGEPEVPGDVIATYNGVPVRLHLLYAGRTEQNWHLWIVDSERLPPSMREGQRVELDNLHVGTLPGYTQIRFPTQFKMKQEP